MATTRARRGAGLGEGGPKVDEDEKRRELAKLDAVQEPRRRPVPLDWREPRRCVVCGDEFTPRRPIQTTCNMDECRDALPLRWKQTRRRAEGRPTAVDLGRDARGRFKRRDG